MSFRGWLAFAGLAAIGWLIIPAVKESGRVKTDLMSLLPPGTGGALKSAALSSLSQASGNRAFFLVEGPDAETVSEAADTLAKVLEGDEAFAGALARFPEPNLSALREFYSGQGQSLPGDTEDLPSRLLLRLHASFPHPLAPDALQDPFGRVLAWVSQIPWPAARLTWANGRISGQTETGSCALVIANLRGEALSMELPAKAARAANRAIEATCNRHAGTKVRKAGAVFHAAHAQETSRRDLELISLGSILGIGAVMLGLFRSPRMLLLCLASIAIGLVTGSAATLAAFGEIHMLVLVFGASLMGEAADYSIQVTVARIGAGDDRDWLAKILPGLRLAILTSVAGYAAMCLAPLPFLGQMGLFALAGLLGAFSFVRFVGPRVLGAKPPGSIPAQMTWLSGLAKRLYESLGTLAIVTGYGLAALGIVISAQVDTVDDATCLIPRLPDLVEDEERLRLATGTGYSQRFLMVCPEEGTDEACLRATESILPQLNELRDSGKLGEYACLARIVPSEKRQNELMAEHNAAMDGQASRIEKVLAQNGLAEALVHLAPPTQKMRVDDFLKSQASAPFRHLRVAHEGRVIHLIVIYPPADTSTLANLALGSDDISVVDKLGDASQSLASLRAYGTWGIPLLLALCALVIATRHGVATSLNLTLPTILGVSWAIPLAHMAGTPVSGLTFMALLLVAGVGINYGIFIKEGGLDNPGSLAGVMACAFTTLLAFGLLAFSEMPALAWIGSTLGAGIIVTLSALPLAMARTRWSDRSPSPETVRPPQ
jgi:predicted exporter